MLYPIPNSWTIGNFETGYNATLSAMDKQFIGTLYRYLKDAPVGPPVGPTGRILKVAVKHNQSQNGMRGMRIRVTFQVHNFKANPESPVHTFTGVMGHL